MILYINGLKDTALDYAVAICEKKDIRIALPNNYPHVLRVYSRNYNPSTDHVLGGEIIDREKIQTMPTSDSWLAVTPLIRQSYYHEGETRLIAAMRCYVASKFGAVIEIPDELIGGSRLS